MVIIIILNPIVATNPSATMNVHYAPILPKSEIINAFRLVQELIAILQ